MATGLWVKTIRNHRIDRRVTIPCTREEPREALLQAGPDLALAGPGGPFCRPATIWIWRSRYGWTRTSGSGRNSA